jgi:hypothetical protein
MEDAHPGFRSVIAARCDGSSHASNRLPNRLFPFRIALSQEEDGGAEEKKYGFAPHSRIIGEPRRCALKFALSALDAYLI